MNVWELHYNMTVQEYTDFNLHYLLKTPEGRKSIRPLKFLSPIIFIPALIITFLIDRSISGLIIRFVFFAVVAVVMGLMAERFTTAVTKRNIRKKMKADPDIFNDEGVSTFDFENRVITARGKCEEVKVRFENIIIVYEDVRAFYLYYSPLKAIVLPYKAFSTTAELMKFREQLLSTFPAERK